MLFLLFLLAAETPASLQPPGGQVQLMKFHARGNQIYVCQSKNDSYTWVFKAPEANLFSDDGSPLGRHYAGPTWESKDGSRVKGKVAATAPSPDAQSIPWLLLSAASHEGSGVMSHVQSIQRLETKGGKAPAGGCDGNNKDHELAVPYEADYTFYGQSNP